MGHARSRFLAHLPAQTPVAHIFLTLANVGGERFADLARPRCARRRVFSALIDLPDFCSARRISYRLCRFSQNSGVLLPSTLSNQGSRPGSWGQQLGDVAFSIHNPLTTIHCLITRIRDLRPSGFPPLRLRWHGEAEGEMSLYETAADNHPHLSR